MRLYSAKGIGDKLSLEDAIVAYIADMGEALKYAFTSPDWKTSISIYSLMIDFLEALSNAVMTNKERNTLNNIEELFAELEMRIEMVRQDELAKATTDQERSSIEEQFDDIISLMQRVEKIIKMKYLIACIKRAYKSSEDFFGENMLIKSICVKLKRYGLDIFMSEEEVRKIIKRRIRKEEAEEIEEETEEVDIA